MLLTPEFVDSVKYYRSRKSYPLCGVVRTNYRFYFKSWWKRSMTISMDWDFVRHNGDSDTYTPSDRILKFERALQEAFGY